jgi:integrase
MKLTRVAVDGLRLPAGKGERIIFDEEIAGFGVRLREGGSRSWIVQYKIGAKHRRLTLGSTALLDPAKARERARDLLAKVRLGRDPAGEKIEARTRADETLGAIAERFLTHQRGRLRPRSLRETERYLRTHWRPLHGLALAKVRRATVSARLAAIADANGKTAADRARAALSAFFTWAIREGLADANPVGFTNKSTDGKSRDRVLSDSEIAAIWRALPENQFGAIVQLLILTGARREEVGGLRWSEINGDKIALPGERTKNGRPLDLPLSSAAADIIEVQPRRADRDLIFGERDGPFQGYSKSKATLDAALDIVAPWRLHDIRRTVATRMADLGVQPHVIEALLNHVSGHKAGVAGTYNRSLYSAEKRRALDLWAAHVIALVAGREST